MSPENDDTKPLETAEAATATDAVASPDPSPTYAAPQPGDAGAAGEGPSSPETELPPVAAPVPDPAPDDKPELVVLGAFAGGFVLASILKRLGS
jgi:hypothetical protein